ncbi:hypothetical protein AV530_015988 [Patagioenas fasciata monilis]|uniref:Uncharacterized protein n=1 Tax=Patagioenas fasciata monilis TaxID=372326 RepID=A0A1V4KJK1_PATFA|nr:hypothetical protein AV530_015988 [Patagioenas fasciata monilis]
MLCVLPDIPRHKGAVGDSLIWKSKGDTESTGQGFSQFHKILGIAFFLLPCCAQGNPSGIPPLPVFAHLPEDGIDEDFISGFLPLVDDEIGDIIHQLEHWISRLEGVQQYLLAPISSPTHSFQPCVTPLVKLCHEHKETGTQASPPANLNPWLDTSNTRSGCPAAKDEHPHKATRFYLQDISRTLRSFRLLTWRKS